MAQPPAPSDASSENEPATQVIITVDARGHRCPTPTLRLRRALETAPLDAAILLLADDPLARIDVPHFLASQGYAPPVIEEVDGALHIAVRKRRGGGSFGKVFTDIR
jgi:tRNA 2-thiouridine synthesizing protein A